MKTGKTRMAVMARAIVMACGAVCIAGHGIAARAAATVVPTDAELDDVTKKLASNDDAQIKAGWTKVRVWLAEHHCPTQVSATWLPGLMKDKHYQEVVDFSLEAALSQPYARNMAKDFDLRAQAYLALNKPQEALAAAKICFNVCEIKETERELKLVSTCLAAAFPDDKGIVQRFRTEQSSGSATGAATDAPATKPALVLDVVKIDASILAPGLATYKARSTKFLDKLYYGNLLLASGDAASAEAIFRGIFTGATAKDRTDSAEAIARALRTQDGNLGRANAWLASVPPETEALP